MFSGKNPQISLLTDFGHDEALYSLRSSIFHINPDARVEDICHTVPHFNILVGAWRLARAVTLPTEREGTIYVAVVDPGVGTDRKPLLIQTKTGKFLVGPDNGLLTIAATTEGVERVYYITNPELTLARRAKSTTFDGKDVFAPVAAHLSKGVKPDEFGNEIRGFSDPDDCIRAISWPKSEYPPGLDGDFLQLFGPVVDIDSFGNIRSAISNRFPGKAIGSEVPFSIGFGEHKISGRAVLRTAFGHGKPGEVQLIPSSTGCFDLAVNCGNASAQFGFGYSSIGLLYESGYPLSLRPSSQLDIHFDNCREAPAHSLAEALHKRTEPRVFVPYSGVG